MDHTGAKKIGTLAWLRHTNCESWVSKLSRSSHSEVAISFNLGTLLEPEELDPGMEGHTR